MLSLTSFQIGCGSDKLKQSLVCRAPLRYLCAAMTLDEYKFPKINSPRDLKATLGGGTAYLLRRAAQLYHRQYSVNPGTWRRASAAWNSPPHSHTFRYARGQDRLDVGTRPMPQGCHRAPRGVEDQTPAGPSAVSRACQGPYDAFGGRACLGIRFRRRSGMAKAAECRGERAIRS